MKGMLNHKELAVTGKITGQGADGKITERFAKGGMVKANKLQKPAVMAPVSPLTNAKRNNGVPGLKKGGKAC